MTTCTFCAEPATTEVMDYAAEPPEYAPVCDEHRGPVEAEGFPPLTDAEFRIAREDLGLTAEQVADRLGVALRTVRRWEHGHSPVPEGVAEQVGEWTDEADDTADRLIASLLDVPEPVLGIPRDGDEQGWPPSWWRAVAARVVEQVDGLRVVYR